MSEQPSSRTDVENDVNFFMSFIRYQFNILMYSKISAPMKSCFTLLTLASIVLKALGQNYPSPSLLSEDFVDTSRIAVRTSIQFFRYK